MVFKSFNKILMEKYDKNLSQNKIKIQTFKIIKIEIQTFYLSTGKSRVILYQYENEVGPYPSQSEVSNVFIFLCAGFIFNGISLQSPTRKASENLLVSRYFIPKLKIKFQKINLNFIYLFIY